MLSLHFFFGATLRFNFPSGSQPLADFEEAFFSRLSGTYAMFVAINKKWVVNKIFMIFQFSKKIVLSKMASTVFLSIR